MKKEDLNSKAIELINKGSIITGTTISSLMSINSINPESLIASSIFGGLFPTVINDFSNRFLSKREKSKVGAVGYYAASKIKDNLNKGKSMNTNFSDLLKDGKWNSAYEIYEEVLLRSKNESQEKKLKFIANIFGNSIFSDIEVEDVFNFLVNTENLTYRKLCIISIYGRNNKMFKNRNIMTDCYSWYPNINLDLNTISVLQDIFELINTGIIDTNNLSVDNYTHLTPSKFSLTQIGLKYFELMNLEEISGSDLEKILFSLEYKDAYGLNDSGKRNSI